MSDNSVTIADVLPRMLDGAPLIDVRAPVEFASGTLPGGRNFPLLNDEERAAVGTTYKRHGQAAAITLGHELVTGSVREERTRAWLRECARDPRSVLFCFRGGLRSRTVQAWLREAGCDRPLIEGGYKAGRRWLRERLEELTARENFLVVCGPTGSGKTRVIRELKKSAPTIDLEALAAHRGSAFGAVTRPQPPVVDFENSLALEMLRLSSMCESPARPWIIEDESRMIGSLTLPENFFLRFREAPVVVIEESLESRVTEIHREYVGEGWAELGPALFDRFGTAIRAISKRLGGVRTEELLVDLARAKAHFERGGRDEEINAVWIRKLLEWYYDPLYRRGWDKRTPVVAHRGSREEVKDWLANPSQRFDSGS